MMKKIFKKEHTGQKVNCALWGSGVITRVSSGSFPIYVKFEDGSTDRYMADGCLNTANNPTLSFGHKESVVFDYGTPEVVYKPLELGELEKSWCYVGNIDEKEVTSKKRRRLVIHSNNDGFYTFRDDLNMLPFWAYAMRCSDFGEEE